MARDVEALDALTADIDTRRCALEGGAAGQRRKEEHKQRLMIEEGTITHVYTVPLIHVLQRNLKFSDRRRTAALLLVLVPATAEEVGEHVEGIWLMLARLVSAQAVLAVAIVDGAFLERCELGRVHVVKLCRRTSLSLSTSYACAISMKRASAPSCLFLSGCHFLLSFLYA